VLPRNIANRSGVRERHELDIAMGGSTNTVLHLLAAAHEGEVDFTMSDIDKLSRKVPVLCKVAPSVPDVHMEDVHRAGGIMGILGELDRAGLIAHVDCRRFTARDVKRRARPVGHHAHRQMRPCGTFFRAGPAGIPTQTAFSQDEPLDSSTTTAKTA
jgi:dihydroxy-acid dehydratase